MTTAQAIAVLVGVTAVALIAMRVGWLRRAARTGALVPGLPTVPGAEELGPPAVADVAVTYVSTTLARRWLEPVAAHGLGARSAALVSVHPEGAVITRRGAPDIFLAAEGLRGVWLADGIAGKVVGGRRIVVIGWRHGSMNLDTGLLPRRASDRERLVAALTALSPTAARPEETK